MTRLFGQAIAKVSTLTSAEQNAIATMILDELDDEDFCAITGSTRKTGR